jgi:hypothetical protein
MARATVREGPPVQGGNVVARWLSEVFQFNSAGLNWMRGVVVLDVLLVPLVFYWAIGHEEYLLSSLFGVLFAALVDPGGKFEIRAARVAIFGLIGAALTGLGFGIGGDAWGWLVLAVFLVTLVASLAVVFGVHRFVTGLLLNVWFIIALASLPASTTPTTQHQQQHLDSGRRLGRGRSAVDRADVPRVADPRTPGRASVHRGDAR